MNNSASISEILSFVTRNKFFLSFTFILYFLIISNLLASSITNRVVVRFEHVPAFLEDKFMLIRCKSESERCPKLSKKYLLYYLNSMLSDDLYISEIINEKKLLFEKPSNYDTYSLKYSEFGGHLYLNFRTFKTKDEITSDIEKLLQIVDKSIFISIKDSFVNLSSISYLKRVKELVNTQEIAKLAMSKDSKSKGKCYLDDLVSLGSAYSNIESVIFRMSNCSSERLDAFILESDVFLQDLKYFSNKDLESLGDDFNTIEPDFSTSSLKYIQYTNYKPLVILLAILSSFFLSYLSVLIRDKISKV